MSKGYLGETCAEAIKNVVEAGEVYTFFELYHRIKEKGYWQDETIWQHLMSCQKLSLFLLLH